MIGHPTNLDGIANRIKGVSDSVRIASDFLLTFRNATSEQRREWLASIREDAGELAQLCKEAEGAIKS